MIKPINLPEKKLMFDKFFETGVLDIHNDYEVFSEAVFADGKSTLTPIIKAFDVVKTRLAERLAANTKYDGLDFYKDKAFKNLEEAIIDVFGIRDASIEPYIEKYDKKSGEFSSRRFGCWAYIPGMTRFPIESLVTEKGFYDKSHAMKLEIIFTCGIIKECTAEELTAIFLHEMGHNIDPAAVDVRYIETNILSKYLTNRKGSLTQSENTYLKRIDSVTSNRSITGTILTIVARLLIRLFINKLPSLIDSISRWFKITFFDKEKAIKRIQYLVKYRQERFDVVNNPEAFADNFARMYGMGPQLFTAIKKIDDEDMRKISLIKKEKTRQAIIAEMITESVYIKDQHKTDVHRIHNLIREYEKDLKDPGIPKEVKKNLESDMEELKKVLSMYLNNKDEFVSKIYNVIYDELKKIDARIEKKEEKEVTKSKDEKDK
jgi:hypothetical protein